MQNIIGIIPARYGSTRFPGKPLVKIAGKTLIQRTYENAKSCKILDKIIIATDDKRIYDHVKEFQGQVIMTSVDCPTGTDRLAEVIRKDSSLSHAQIIVNIQGDEPTIDPKIIESVAITLNECKEAAVATAVVQINSEEEALNPSVVKCVLDLQGFALYFSRGLIPAGKNLKYDPGQVYFRHLGLYAYRRDFLLHYGSLSQTPLQLAEDLEQLRVLENGYRIKAAIVEGESRDVNTPEDIKKVEPFICKQNTYL